MKTNEAYNLIINKAKELKLKGIKSEIQYLKDEPYPYRNFKDDFILPYKKWIRINFTIKIYSQLAEIYQAENELQQLGVFFHLTGDSQNLIWNVDSSFSIKKRNKKKIKYHSL